MNFLRKSAYSSASCLQSAALAAALIGLAGATAAQAQTAAPAPAPVCEDGNGNGVCDSEEGSASAGGIVVTGSRIRSPNATSNIPITTVRSEDIIQQGQNNLGDTLNDLPQLRSTFNQQNPGAGVGITGLNLLDLRGLGTVRTLVLVNGRRHVGSDILNNAVSVDVNCISNDLIERVDIVTGGNSAVYGSDAISGVVNFVLKRNYNGLQVSGNAGVSGTGYGGNQFLSVLGGKNFADGRGNIILQAEYAHQDQTYASQIPFLRKSVDGFATVDVDTAGLPQNSDGFPDAVFVRDIRSSTNHRFGLAVVPQPTVGGACGYGTGPTNGPPNTAGTAFSCNYIFQPDGSLVPQTGTRIGTGPAGTFLGGNGQTGREDRLLSVFPRNDRFNVNLLAHYTVSNALELFVEGKYARTISVGNQLGPTFLNNSTGSLGTDVRLDPRLDNPFLNPTARQTIANAYLAANCGYTLGSATSAATCQTGSAATQAARAAAIADGSYRFLFARSFTDSPNREELFHRQTYRVVGGIRGDFYSNWHYELSANYGRFEEKTDVFGFVDRQRFLLSIDAGRNPDTNAIQCRSQFNAASANGAPGLAGTAATASKLASDIAACVPYNLFGTSNNSAAVQYFKANIHNDAYLSQFDATGYVTGDTGHWFNLPGGPAAFSLGGEYRVEKAFNNSGDGADTFADNFVYLGDVNSKPLRVLEGFGELKLPLIKDVPFFHELTLSGAGRVSHYNNGAGTVFTWNAGGEWAPVQDLRLRVNYGRALRAPNSSETSFPNVPNFANGFIDPCNVNAISTGTAARTTNCQALTTAQLGNLQTAGYSLHVISGSNPNLISETSRSVTLGAIFTPRFIPGLTLSADYFNINVRNTIVSLSAQTIVNSCYDSPNLSSPLCAGFRRNLTASNGPEGELPGQILGLSIVQGPQNFARRVSRGLDVNLNYDHSFSPDVRLGSRLIYTHTFQRSNFENPSIPQTQNYIAGELGDPTNEAQFDVNLKVHGVTFGYGAHYIGPMFTSTFEAFNVNNVGVPGQTGLPTNSDAIDIQKYPAVIYQNVKVSFAVVEDGARTIDVYFGVNNVTDRNPPFGLSGTGAGSSIYSLRGRSFFAGFKAKLY